MRYRRPGWTTLAATAVLALAASAAMAFSKPVEVRVDGQRVISDVPPITTAKSGVFVPLRPVSDALGAETRYERRSGEVVVARGDSVLHLKVGSRQATVDGKPVTMRTAPFRVRGRVMVSLRTVQQVFGLRVKFDNAAARVDFNTPGVPTTASETQ